MLTWLFKILFVCFIGAGILLGWSVTWRGTAMLAGQSVQSWYLVGLGVFVIMLTIGHLVRYIMHDISPRSWIFFPMVLIVVLLAGMPQLIAYAPLSSFTTSLEQLADWLDDRWWLSLILIVWCSWISLKG